MKPILRYTLLALGLVTVAALPAQAVTSFSETFSAASLNATRWSLSNDGGLLSPSDGKLHYSASDANGERDSHIILRGIQPKFNESWEVIVDAANSMRANSRAWIGVAILNAADPNDWVGLQIEGGKNRTDINSDFATNGVEPAEVVKRTSFTKASLRVTFSSATKVITMWYRTSPSAPWTKHATFSTTNSATAMRRGNWRMKPAGGFKIGLFGGGDDGVMIPLGRMSLDNFQVRNLK